VAKLGVILREVEAPEEEDDEAKDGEGEDKREEKALGQARRTRKHPYTIVETIKVTE
jgi:hypothetical protein